MDEFYRVDIYIPSLDLIVEVEGPSHMNGFYKPNKKTLTKRRVINKYGHKFCFISVTKYLGQNG
jgi:very-short-patch-repair endonuclease